MLRLQRLGWFNQQRIAVPGQRDRNRRIDPHGALHGRPIDREIETHRDGALGRVITGISLSDGGSVRTGPEGLAEDQRANNERRRGHRREGSPREQTGHRAKEGKRPRLAQEQCLDPDVQARRRDRVTLSAQGGADLGVRG